MKIFEKNFTLSNSIGHVVNIVANKMKQELEISFEKNNYDITALQWMVLGIIYENEGINQNELSKKSKKDKTNIARITDKLEKKALIERIQDDIDKRTFRLYTTNLGKNTREKLTQIVVEEIKKSTIGISEDEYTICLNVLKKIYSNLE
jgi:DNA-binding MarR family transcriptional regulator